MDQDGHVSWGKFLRQKIWLYLSKILKIISAKFIFWNTYSYFQKCRMLFCAFSILVREIKNQNRGFQRMESISIVIVKLKFSDFVSLISAGIIITVKRKKISWQWWTPLLRRKITCWFWVDHFFKCIDWWPTNSLKTRIKVVRIISVLEIIFLYCK